MFIHSLRILVPVFCLIQQVFAGPVASEELSTPDLIKALQSGGHIIYMRHAPTDMTQIDKDKNNLDDCSSQRNLNATGRFLAELIGNKINILGIPVGNVSSSPYCRCKDTARLAFGKFHIEPDLRFSYTDDSEESRKLGELLYSMMMNSEVGPDNEIFVGHTSNLKEGLGVWPKPEGAVVVFQRRENGLVYKGMITPDKWP